MFKTALIYLTALFCTAAFCHRADAVIVDRIVATVNGEVITLSELESRAEIFFKAQVARGVDLEQLESRKKEILAQILLQMTDEKIVQKEIRNLGIEVGEDEVDAALERIRRNNHIAEDEFAAQLASEGIVLEEYRKEVKKQIERSRLINAEVRGKIVITDEQIDRYLAEHPPEKTASGPLYLLQHICTIPRDPQDPVSRQEALERARKALGELEQGVSFAEVAGKYSDAPSAAEGGALGAFSEKDMADFLKAAVMQLEPGEFSDIIDTPAGWQIFRLEAVEQGGRSGRNTALRNKIRQELYKQQVDKRFGEWLRELRSKSTIRILL